MVASPANADLHRMIYGALVSLKCVECEADVAIMPVVVRQSYIAAGVCLNLLMSRAHVDFIFRSLHSRALHTSLRLVEPALQLGVPLLH